MGDCAAKNPTFVLLILVECYCSQKTAQHTNLSVLLFPQGWSQES